MKLAEKLVNKSIYLQILIHTKSEDILRTYVDLLVFFCLFDDKVQTCACHSLIELLIFVGF